MWAMDAIEEIVQIYENYETMLPKILLDTSVEDGSRIVYFPSIDDCLYCFKKLVDEVRNLISFD
jgi:hypothetical protein